MLDLLNGRIEPGRGRAFWIAAAVLVMVMLVLPAHIGRYAQLNLNALLLMVFLAAGLALLWGFCGVLSLGQSAFFGLGGYGYGIIAINLAGSPWASMAGVAGGIVLAVAFAVLMSWLTFYGHLRGVYVSIVTLVVTLVIESFLNQTAGPQWKIGAAHLGGNNGLGRFSGAVKDLPSLTFPTGAGQTLVAAGSSQAFYYILLTLIVAIYLGLRMAVNSRFGVTLAAVREDPDRAETLGYDVRLLQSVTFCISAALAALSGLLYVAWGNFITPSVFGVTANVLPVIWVAVAGRKSLAAAIVGAVIMQWTAQELAISGGDYALILQGFLLVVAVLILPEGVVSLAERYRSLFRRTVDRSTVEEMED